MQYTVNELINKFKEQVMDIQDHIIRIVILNSLDNIPDYFYHVPSSSTGKYHPEDEICEGGLLLHTLKTVVVAKDLANMYNLTSKELDYVIAALLMHDTCKNGFDGSKYTQFLHPKYAAELVINSNKHLEYCFAARKIARLISSHMGRWNKDNRDTKAKHLLKPVTKLQKIVHECDFIASRKDISINI